MAEKVVVITGASSGIGAQAARQLAARGATVVPIGRSVQRSTELARSLGVKPLIADFANLIEVRQLADQILADHERIDVLLNNAGGLFTPRSITVDGYETTLQVNHLAPFLLTNLLRERLIASARTNPVRVINTASVANLFGRIRLDDLDWERRRWSAFRAYATTKLMNIVFTRELARRWAGTNIATASFHPGGVATNFASSSWLAGLVYRSPLKNLLLISAAQGAAPLIWLASDADSAALDGTYYHRLRRNGPASPQANDAGLAAALWERSAQLTGTGIPSAKT
ncbi:MAG: short-chain dehydrogenase [Acidimicrobiales bacterium]|nr:MAG: short-chain dehydrogenase [Acidimicrobiales bacterium]